MTHRSGAVLVLDGRVVAAAQEERFSRIKHDAALPAQAIASCLHEAGIEDSDVSLVAYYDKPLLTFEGLVDTWLAAAPRGYRSLAAALPAWVEQKLLPARRLAQGPLSGYRHRFVYTEHHGAHAAAAFFPSPFEEAAI